MEKEIFKVLWFDDNPKVSFIDNAFISGISITAAENLDKGLALISSSDTWDAFIFDANYKKKDDAQSSLILSDLINEVVKISNDKTPWFVLTAGDFSGIEAISYIIPESIWEKELGTKRFYNKVSEDEEFLFDDIKRTVKWQNTVEWKTKNKYYSVFNIFDIKNQYIAFSDLDGINLLNLLIYIEKQEYSVEPHKLNEIRKFVAGGVMKTLKNLGVIPESIKELNAKGKHLCDPRFKESIPIHIQRAFHSIISTCQDGSHSCSEGADGEIPPQIDKIVREGNAPFLIYSLVYELLNILTWLKVFISEFNDKERNLIDFKIREAVDNKTVENSLECSNIIGVIEQDENRNFHCNEYLLNYNYTQTNFKIGDEIEITEFQDNGNSRTSLYYSRYATKFKKI